MIDEIVAGCGSVLEVGCGGGQLACRLTEHHPGLRVTGVDLAVEQVERATRRANTLPADRRGRLDFQTASALELPFRDNSFDAAVSIGSIKHWPDQARGLREMVRVLKDGGLIVVAELDRGGRSDDIRALARTFKFTALLRPLYLLVVRT
ncbi:MAG: class I SAM-dependent methyltransferase, partial [Mycobacterium sp.]